MEGGLGLAGAYGAMLGRIKAQDVERAKLGMAVLMWISHSMRPLQMDELRHAIAIRIGSSDLGNDEIPAISTWLSCCQGLAIVDKGASTVRLIHFTLQEYLGTHPDLFDKAHATMAETCLTYLNFQHFKDLPAGSSPGERGTPFLKYSSLYWGTHMRMELSDRAKTLALELLVEWDSHASAKYLWKSVERGLPTHNYYPRGKPFPALHCISYFGIADVADTLIQMKRWDVNQRDSAGMTPLIWAARNGHEPVVGLLLRQKHIKPDRLGGDEGQTALSWAARNGHERVVRIFLGPQFVNPGTIGRLWGARLVVGQMFGLRYINPDAPDSWYDRTPLSWAAGNGHEGIVKLLLERKDVNPDIPESDYGRTPLSWAAANGHVGIVMLLLGRRDVNNDSLSKSDRTPLSWAAEYGHEGVVKMLLERKDVNPNTLDTMYGRTPLSWGAGNGREGVVKILLERKDVNPDSSSKFGRTPLSWAAGKGHEGVVKILLERNDVNPDSSSKSGRTPLSWAAANGHEGVVRLLLERRDVNPDSPDTMYSQTPLSWAASNGHEGVVRLLLERRDVNPDTLDTGLGRTPLSWAATNGREGVVKVLLERKDVNPDSKSESGRTPLSWAAANGREGIVKILLERKDVDPNSSTKSRQTPLMLAARNRHDTVVKLLQVQRS